MALSTAERQRLYRQRKRKGSRFALVEIPAEVSTELMRRGWIENPIVSDATVLGNIISDVLDCWARGTLKCDGV